MEFWVFGYSSLMWNVGFSYEKKIKGYIKGFKRAFHLACFDHRGTLESPARVATLEHDETSICWGIAYYVRDPLSTKLKKLMDRESEYDDLRYLEFFTETSGARALVSNVLVFMSSTSSKYYLGPAPRDKIARQIALARGPCGLNSDYLYRLVDALRHIGHEEEEILELAESVRKIQLDLGIDNCLIDKKNESMTHLRIMNASSTFKEDMMNVSHLQPLTRGVPNS